MAQARITVKDTQNRILRGHPWVFANQIIGEEGEYVPGDMVQVFDDRQRPLGQGYINPASLIRVRLLTPHVQDRVDADFIKARIASAWNYRQQMGYSGSCRVIFGEADLLPGLVVDKFNDVLSVQFLTLGMERWKDVVLVSLSELIHPKGIYLRNDVAIREKEGLEQYKGPYGASFATELVIDENGLRLQVDVANGQKTGHFLDQVLNHAEMRRISTGQRVLDCFTHTGGFGLHAAHYGASKVLGLDISEDAVAQATRNAEVNELTTCTFKVANVFDYLTEASRTGNQWNVIVLDPPAFAKSRSAIDNAYRGYKEINLRALKCIPSGGFLVTCSCSQHMTPELFRKMVNEAARDAGRQLREVYSGGQPPDHPVLWGVPETHYLKCLILHVL
ncbi:MAG: class I SAM-dependent rRNA methyltransferase [Flavobacteriales bacterium]|nr:class I SAM-dependent rRNA methyltransferase [Flavobacteriales bacterium]MBK8532242.1 class I SAM-dependent rRNA methyltransferase [Flavobacteriales bacterium]